MIAGGKGLPAEWGSGRKEQMCWGRRRAEAEYGTIEYTVADRAYTRYGLLLGEILGEPDG